MSQYIFIFIFQMCAQTRRVLRHRATAPPRFVVFMAMAGAVQRLLQLQTNSTTEQRSQNAQVANAHCNGNGNEVTTNNKSATYSKDRSVMCEELLELFELSQMSM